MEGLWMERPGIAWAAEDGKTPSGTGLRAAWYHFPTGGGRDPSVPAASGGDTSPCRGGKGLRHHRKRR